MAEPNEAASSLQPPGARHASGIGSIGSASVDRSRHSMSSAGGSSLASGTTHVEANGPGSDNNLSFLELANTTSSSHVSSRLSATSPTPQIRRDHELSRTARPSHRSSHRHNRSSGAFLLNDALSSARPSQDANHGKPTQHSTRSSARERHRSDGNSHRGGATLAPSVTPEKRGRGSSAEPAPEAQRLRNASSSPGGAVSPTSADTAVVPATAAAPTTATLPSPPSSAGPASPAAPNQAMDIDSAQIVNMALELSAMRHFTSRRNDPQQLPPRLAPLPDSAVGGSLLRQLQQQRRISRTISPRPDRGPGGRAVSGQIAGPSPRVSSSSGLQPPFDLMGDGGSGSFRYYFSKSTLARAQKAKDYLELLAQQRRLLEFIPPLTPISSTQVRSTSLTSPPTSSSSSHPSLRTGPSSGDLISNSARLGRPYNPLQYIRNRKVRLRERKIIDGEALGFGDVSKAAEWVDEVARWAATGQSRIPGGPTLPSFATADALTAALQSSPPPGSRSAVQGVMTKPKRPRFDWAIDPADMLADVYWLEQGDNKMLVEDHHWRRVFPQDPSLYRPASQRVDDGIALDKTSDPSVYPPTSFLDPSTGHSLRTSEHAAAEIGQGSTRKRGARQKFSELRTFHHRHNSSFQSQDNLRLRHDSLTGTSDSDSDRGLFGRRAKDRFGAQTNSSNPNMALLRKAAAESREKDGNSSGSPTMSGDYKNQMNQASAGPSPTNVNANAQFSQSTPAKGEPSSRNPTTLYTTGAVDNSVRSSRASLDIPTITKRRSLDYDSSLPASPELPPLSNEGMGLIPVLGGDLSPPPSRAASPPPSRFSKVKHMFRDHSHERGRERTNSSGFDRGSQERDDLMTVPYNYNQSLSPPQHEVTEVQSAPITASASVAGEIDKIPDSKDPYQSPLRKGLSRSNTATFDSHKSHSSITSIASLRHSNHIPSYGSQNQHRSEVSTPSASASSTLRGIFKSGPRIDTMLRSSVSKVSDILWRRDGSDAPYDGAAGVGDVASSSDDDSDGELTLRGRWRKTPHHSRSPSMNADWSEKSTPFMSKQGEKHYLHVMPTFGSQDHRGGHSGHHHLTPSPDPVSRPSSRRSTRFERLKPPRIDVQDATSPNSDIADFRPQFPRRETGDSASLLPSGHQYKRQRGQRTTQDSDISESDTSKSRRVSNVNSDVLDSVEEPPDSSSVTVRQQPSRQLVVPTFKDGFSNADRPRWSISQPTYRNQGDSLSRREVARLRASMYSSAVLARELTRRANSPHVMGDSSNSESSALCVRRKVVASRHGELLAWPDIAIYSTNPRELMQRPIRHVELYPLVAQVLGGAIQRSGQSWQTSAELFNNSTVPALRKRVDSLRERVAVELSGMAHKAADEADTVSQNLVAVQRLQVIGVERKIEHMMRRRRRRFRWVRRAGWLTVEWVLVGIMWMAWFVVMIARVVMGSYSGIVAAVRWLLWM